MKPDDAAVQWIEEPDLTFLERTYLPSVLTGLGVTARHFTGHKVTVSFPEQRHEPTDIVGYRGAHRLNRDAEGRVKCVACFLCSTACPAHCIDIVAEESPWADREKYPKTFVIDELRCIFCGMCEEACPVDAIELTSIYDLTGQSREQMKFDKEKLLSIYDETKDREPMRTSGQQLPRGLPREAEPHA